MLNFKKWMSRVCLLLLFNFYFCLLAEEGESLKFLDPAAPDYQTPLAGEGFRTIVLGEKVVVQPRDRRKLFAWDVGLSSIFPHVEDTQYLPFGSLYYWYRPTGQFLFRGIFAGVYNELLWGLSSVQWSPFEFVGGIENLTSPFAFSDYEDGVQKSEEELLWGWVRPALGLGVRMDLGEVDNMFETSFLFEPGFLYFSKGNNTVSQFVLPKDTFDFRFHIRSRFDELKRNILELPHEGVALGADVFWGHRLQWENWGINRKESKSQSKDYWGLSAYAWLARKLPCIKSERHRLIGSLHGAYGWKMDRFSKYRVGGGPGGTEYYTLSLPLMPGAFIREFVTSRYLIAVAEYRFEPLFFSYISVRSSLSYLEQSPHHDRLFPSIGGRLTTGFLFDTQLQLDYNYNWRVKRERDIGGHEITFHISGMIF